MTWLLAGVALVSLVWAAISLFFFIREEHPRLRAAHALNEPRLPQRPVRPSAVRPLFADVPASIRSQILPGSQVSLATDVRAAEQRGGEPLWRDPESSALDPLKPHVPPGRQIDGWLMRVHWSILRDQGGSSKYDYWHLPPIYELTLRFPEALADYGVLFWGHNYDFRSKEFTCPKEKFEGLKDGDWVRVFGVLRPGSRIEWETGKGGDSLSLGEITITDIQRVHLVDE